MNKVNIDIDIGRAFDELSILEIKNHQKSSSALQSQIKDLQSKINFAIGSDLAQTIHNSIEYKELLSINLSIFKLIDNLRFEENKEEMALSKIAFLGLDILHQNDDRYKMKQSLQRRFFGNQIEEIKL